MKSLLRILILAIFSLGICQSNVQAQGIKGLFNKTKSAVAPKAKEIAPKSKAISESKGSSASPAKPLAPEVKNSVSELRSYTGLTKEAFIAKMKSQGFVATQDPVEGEGFRSKSGYFLAAEYGTRSGALYVRTATKCISSKSPNLASVKTTYLDLGKQCTDLKAKYDGGWIKALDRKGTNKTYRASEDRNAKFVPAFSAMISTKEEGAAADQYTEKDYNYFVNYLYAKMLGSTITIKVTDLTIESQFG
jgi:hypothetical protein